MKKNKHILFILLFFMNATTVFCQSQPSNKIINRIMVVMFENEDLSMVIRDSNFKSIADSGTLLTNYYGVTHPSQPNYIATIGGSHFNCSNDNDITIDASNLVDLLDSTNTTWKAYMEDLPATNKLIGSYNNLYYRKHNPFVSFKNNQDTPRLNYVVNAQQLYADLASNHVPAFCWYTPNIQNDGHTPPLCSTDSSGGDSCHIAFAGAWLKSFINTLRSYPQFMDSTLIVITFDECYPTGNNYSIQVPIYTVLLGPASLITKGMQYDGCYGALNTQCCSYCHYNLLATIEKNFNLGNLGRNDLISVPFNFLWNNAAAQNARRKKVK